MSGLLSSSEGHLRDVLEACHGNMDNSRGEAGDPGSLSICYPNFGILINFQKETGIITFRSVQLRVPVEVLKGFEASCLDEAGT